MRDLRWLALDLVQRPTQISEIIPTIQPATVGSQDTATPSMGGVHLVPLWNGTIQPLLCPPFDPRSIEKLVTFTNPKGTITNSDLELAAIVATHDILV
jgi:hypothetical protein